MPDNDKNMDYCNFPQFEKNKYFYGKLMTVKDFETEQQYFDGKRYFINRLLHGTGIICGFTKIEFPTNKEGEKEYLKIKFIDGGMSLTCCGHEIVVLPGKDKQILDESGNRVSDLSYSPYLYLKYKSYDCGYIAVASNSSSCEDKCCPGRIIDDFEVVASSDSPNSGIICNNESNLVDWLNVLEDNHKVCSKCQENQKDRVFLGTVKSNGSVIKIETEKNRIYFTSKELYQIIKCHAYIFDSHTSNFDNPHRVSAEQINALVSLDGVSNPGGDIDLIQNGSIVITSDDRENSITIGETHSAIKEGNPHNVTARETGALITLNQVENFKGNIDLIQKGSIVIEPEDDKNSITIGETHSAIKEGNPHNVTARDTGALVSLDGVSNPGGNINLIQSGSIEISPDNSIHTVTIGETHSAKEDNPHRVTALQTGALVSLDGIRNPGGNIDLIEGMNIKIIPDENNNSITFDCTLGLEVQPAEAEPKSVGIKNVVGTSTRYSREDHEHKLEENFVDYTRLSVDLQKQLDVLNMYLRERALKCSVSSFKKLEKEFKNDKSLGISLLFKKGVREKVYEKETGFLDFMNNILDKINAFKEEIKTQVEEGSFKDFSDALEDLRKALKDDTPLRVAAQQDEVCFYALELKRNVNEPMFRALNCTVNNFRKIANTFKSEVANRISLKFEQGIGSRVYENEDAFIEFITVNHQLLKDLPDQIKENTIEETLNNYISAVDRLGEVIESNDALSIAATQEEICSAAKGLEPISENPMYRALRCTVSSFRGIYERFDSDVANKIADDFEEALKNKVYDDENAFIEFMKENIEFLSNLLPEEVKHNAIEKDLTNYLAVINELTDKIRSNNALEIAAKQEELCFFARELNPANSIYRALKCTAVNFVKIADVFENKNAKRISVNFGKSVENELYEDENEFMNFMKDNVELFGIFAGEIKDISTKETFHSYNAAVKKLEEVIDSGDAHKIAARQEEVCSSARELEIHSPA